jgi:hypothetical protein
LKAKVTLYLFIEPLYFLFIGREVGPIPKIPSYLFYNKNPSKNHGDDSTV